MAPGDGGRNIGGFLEASHVRRQSLKRFWGWAWPGFKPHTTIQNPQYYVNTPGVMCARWLCKSSIQLAFHPVPTQRMCQPKNILISPPHASTPHYSPCLSRAARWNKKQRGCLPALHCSVPCILRRITAAVEIIACSNYESISCAGFSVWWGGNSQEQFWTMCKNNARERVSGH